MDIQQSGTPENQPHRDQHSSILMLYRENDLFRHLLPEVAEELLRQGLRVRMVPFPPGTTPPAMLETLSSLALSHDSTTLLVTDVSARRGIRALNESGIELLSAAHSGVLLDRSLASTVKKLIATELRAPLLTLMANTPSPVEMAARGEITLRAERVFFEALLGPLVAAHTDAHFIIAAPMLLHHLPFVSYIGALQANYCANCGGPNDIITEKLLAWEGPGSILHQSRIPSAVRAHLNAVASEPVVDPCDWIAETICSLGVPTSHITVVDSPTELALVLRENQDTQPIVLGDRHLFSESTLINEFVKSGLPTGEAAATAKLCLSAPTFRLPLESLVADIADAGLLSHLKLLHTTHIRTELANAIAHEIRLCLEKRRAG